MHQAVSVELVGHTDITGVEAANLPLSRERADQIRAALLRNGVKSANLRRAALAPRSRCKMRTPRKAAASIAASPSRSLYLPLPPPVLVDSASGAAPAN